jgi:hypothetical protein
MRASAVMYDESNTLPPPTRLYTHSHQCSGWQTSPDGPVSYQWHKAGDDKMVIGESVDVSPAEWSESLLCYWVVLCMKPHKTPFCLVHVLFYFTKEGYTRNVSASSF